MTEHSSPLQPGTESIAPDALFSPAARFAIYYAPPALSPWWEAGCRWLQRDPGGAVTQSAPIVPGLSRPLADLTTEPRRYGWHATLVAPFTCRPGIDSQAVLARAANWASRQRAFMLTVRVGLLECFVAIQAVGETVAGLAQCTALSELAADAVRTFAPLRAMPSAAELAKRRTQALSTRQEALMLEWGYPYVFDEFRFHLTLSNSIESADAQAMLVWWTSRCAALGPLPIEGVAIYVQAQPGEDFYLWQRLPFGKPLPNLQGES